MQPTADLGAFRSAAGDALSLAGHYTKADNMDLRQQFERRVDEAAVARILQSIATVPNRREKPTPADEAGAFDFWFDGGAAAIQTGSIEYKFADGTRATLAAPIPALSLTIEFANGCLVTVQQKSWGLEQAG